MRLLKILRISSTIISLFYKYLLKSSSEPGITLDERYRDKILVFMSLLAGNINDK